jgi:peptidoglycan/LPS O-acetylase OafA/YrhL
MDPRAEHLRYVDGLRAVAVLAVVFYHAICYASWAAPLLSAPMRPQASWWFATLASKGAHGVDLFFVISGFCLSYPTLARLAHVRRADFDVRNFFAKRLVRILPPYYVAIALFAAATLVAAHLGLHNESTNADGTGPSALAQQVLFLDRDGHNLVNAFWTLAVEFRWYLVFPLLLALYVRASRPFFIVMLACVLAFNLTSLRAIDIATLPAFMLGIVAADWSIRPHRFARFSIVGLLVSLDLALLLEPWTSAPSQTGGADQVGFYLQTNVGWQLAAFFFVVTAGRTAAIRSALACAPLVAIGAAAYAIYLVHMPIVGLWDQSWGASAGPIENISGAVVLATIGGSLFYVIGERPFLVAPLRPALLRKLGPQIARLLRFSHLPERFTLDVAPVAPGTFAIETTEVIVPSA